MTAWQRLGLFVGVNLAVALVVAAPLTVFMARSYRKIAGLGSMDLSPRDRALVHWSILGQIQLVLWAPLVAGCVTAVWSPSAAWWVLGVGWTTAATWLAVDVRLQRITGNHLTYYAVYTFNTEAWKWGGDIASIGWKMSGYAIPAGAITAALVCGASVSARLLEQHGLHQWIRPLVAAGVALHVVLIVGLLVARRGIGNALALERLYQALPISLGLFSRDAVPGVARTAFGVDCDRRFTDVLAPAFAGTRQPAPLDHKNLVTRADPPSVLIVIVESFRAQAMQRQVMPLLYDWSRPGMRLTQHYAASNNSYMGDFALLYGRSPLAYDAHIGAMHLPQLCATLKQSGYQTSLFGSAGFNNHHMYRFMGRGGFDHVEIATQGAWPDRDLQGLNQAAERLRQAGGRPQLVVATIYSTHYGYYYPPRFGRLHTSMSDQRGVKRGHLTAEDVRNRYRNCLAFVDDAISRFLAGVDMDRHIVIVTGDHGESFGEDGFRFHSSRLSDAQTHVPMVIRGPGIPSVQMDRLTCHIDILPTLMHALAGRPMPIDGCHGRDLLHDEPGEDAVLLVQPQFDSWDLLLVRPDGRLALNLLRDTCKVRVMGFCDEHGRVDAGRSRSPDDIDAWCGALTHAIRQIGGHDRPLPNI